MPLHRAEHAACCSATWHMPRRSFFSQYQLLPPHLQAQHLSSTRLKVSSDPAFAQIIAARPLQAGQEIFNTYGELGNAELVAKYGFALPDNPFDKLTLDKATLLELACDLLSKKALAQRCEFLERER